MHFAESSLAESAKVSSVSGVNMREVDIVVVAVVLDTMYVYKSNEKTVDQERSTWCVSVSFRLLGFVFFVFFLVNDCRLKKLVTSKQTNTARVACRVFTVI